MTIEEKILEADSGEIKSKFLREIKDARLYEKDYLKWDEKAVDKLFEILKTGLNKDESRDATLFDIMAQFLKAYPEKSVVIQEKTVKAMEKYTYEEYYMDKCMSLLNMSAAISHWEKETIGNLCKNVLSVASGCSKNTDHEYGGTYYSTLKMLAVLSESTDVDDMLKKYYYEGGDNPVYPYQDEERVIDNVSTVLVNSRQYEKAVSFIDESINKVSEENRNLLTEMHLKAARALAGLNRNDEAVESANKAKSIYPEKQGPYYFLSELYYGLNETDKCIAEFDNFYEATGGKNYILEDKMNRLISFGLFEEAVKTADILIEKNYRVVDVEKGKNKALELMNN